MHLKGNPLLKSPQLMFKLGQYQCGFRGDDLPWDGSPYPLEEFADAELAEDEIENFGVDWEETEMENNEMDGQPSWNGDNGQPHRLNDVPVHDPLSPFAEHEWRDISSYLPPRFGSTSFDTSVATWKTAQVHVERYRPGFF